MNKRFEENEMRRKMLEGKFSWKKSEGFFSHKRGSVENFTKF
jgi:hypothetical protein